MQFFWPPETRFVWPCAGNLVRPTSRSAWVFRAGETQILTSRDAFFVALRRRNANLTSRDASCVHVMWIHEESRPDERKSPRRYSETPKKFPGPRLAQAKRTFWLPGSCCLWPCVGKTAEARNLHLDLRGFTRVPQSWGKTGVAEDRLPTTPPKSAPPCGKKAIRKSKSLKSGSIWALFEIQVRKICTALWRESGSETKVAKSWRCRTTFWSSSRQNCTSLWRESDLEVKIVKAPDARTAFWGSKCFSRGARSDFDRASASKSLKRIVILRPGVWARVRSGRKFKIASGVNLGSLRA